MKKIIASLIVFISILSLSACGSKYNVDVDLSDVQREAVKMDMQKMKDAIAAYDTSDNTIPYGQIITVSKDYEKLGDLDNAIKNYKIWLDKGLKTKSLINNLGRLYEKVGETELAVTQYKRLIDEYQDDSYLYDITWAYINGKKRKEAEKFFNLWQLKFQKTDEQTQQAIIQLRAEEQKTQQQ
jgi:tetratricopeptide (TPR) repeat protein